MYVRLEDLKAKMKYEAEICVSWQALDRLHMQIKYIMYVHMFVCMFRNKINLIKFSKI